MPEAKTKFLLTGATGTFTWILLEIQLISIGYIGGSVLNRFLMHPQADSFHFNVLVRDPKKAEYFRHMGITAVVGSHSDAPLVEKLASEVDVVIATVGGHTEFYQKLALRVQ